MYHQLCLYQGIQYRVLFVLYCSPVLPYTFLRSSRTKWLRSGGVEFKKGAGVVFGMKNDLPQVGQITNLYVINSGTVLFRVIPFSCSWCPHFRGYALHEEPNGHDQLLYMSELVVHTPVHIRRPQALQTLFIILPHHVH